MQVKKVKWKKLKNFKEYKKQKIGTSLSSPGSHNK